jgi:hypothetical protein
MGGKKGLMTRRFGGRGVARVNNITQAIDPLTKGRRETERKKGRGLSFMYTNRLLDGELNWLWLNSCD